MGILLKLCLGVLLYLFSNAFFGTPLGVDTIFPILKYIAIIFSSLFIFVSIVSWGNILSQILKHDKAFEDSLLIGSLFTSLSYLILGNMGLIGSQYYILTIIYFVFGYIGFDYKLFYNSQILSFYDKNKMVSFIFFIFILANVFLCFEPQTSTDPLYYHLLAPRLWYDKGGIDLLESGFIFFRSSYWEMIYLSIIGIFNPAPGQSLLYNHLLAQLLHFEIGFIGVLFYLLKILKRTELYDTEKTPLILMLSLIFIDSFFINTAKNDWGIMFWSLGGLYFLILTLTEQKRRNYIISGLIIGFSLAAKWTSVVAILPISLLFVFQKKTSPRNVLFLLLSVLAPLSIIFIQNYYYTKNPLFPLFPNFFDKAITTTYYNDYISNLSNGFNLSLLSTYQYFLKKLFLYSPLLLFCWVPLLFYRRIKNKNLIYFFLPSLISFICYIFLLPKMGFWRYLGFSTVFLNYTVLYLLKEKIKPNFIVLIFCLITLLGFNYNKIKTFTSYSNPSLKIRNYRGGQSMAWLRKNVKSDSILFGGNSERYYVSHLNTNTFELSVKLTNENLLKKTPRDIIKILVEKYQYKYFVTTYIGQLFWGELANALNPMFEQFKNQIEVYRGKDSKVIDLIKLQHSLNIHPDLFNMPLHSIGNKKYIP